MNTMNTTNTIILAFSLILMISLTGMSACSKPEKEYQLEALKLEDGWGYKISVQGKPYIVQEIIPAIQGSEKFKDSLSACRIGELVIDKLENKKSPTITVNELIEAGIIEMPVSNKD